MSISDSVYSSTYFVHVTVDTETVYISPHLYHDPTWSPARNIPALLRTRRLVNEEATPALYASTEFLVDIYGQLAKKTLKTTAFEIQNHAFLKHATRIEELDIFQSDDVAAVTIAQTFQSFISMLSPDKRVALATFEVHLTKEPPENMDPVFQALLDWNCGPSLYMVYFVDGGNLADEQHSWDDIYLSPGVADRSASSIPFDNRIAQTAAMGLPAVLCVECCIESLRLFWRREQAVPVPNAPHLAGLDWRTSTINKETYSNSPAWGGLDKAYSCVVQRTKTVT
ncbi:hypothetical protein LTR17_020248 [Elasticomyces elasticus]|nr:hypothetical protein LTR17_020248 [Elasticomyces elasticus]